MKHIFHKWVYLTGTLRTCKICRKHQEFETFLAFNGWVDKSCADFAEEYERQKDARAREIKARQECRFCAAPKEEATP